MTTEYPANNLPEDAKRTIADARPICIWATISKWCLLLGCVLILIGCISTEIVGSSWIAFVLKCLGKCGAYVFLSSPISGVVALVLIRKSRGKLRGVERAGTCLVLSLMFLTPSIGLALNSIKTRSAEILGPFRDGDIVKARELLVSKPRIANKRLIWGDSPMHAAASRGHLDLVELLIEYGAEVDIQSASEKTPLHRAAAWGRVEVVTLLLEKGADVGARDSGGRTPLHEAAGAYENSEAVVTPLLGRGADPSVEDNYGRTPLHVAEERKREGAARLLREYGKEK